MENIKIFNGLDKNSISRIEKFMQKRVYIAGEKIFQEGECDYGKEKSRYGKTE